MKGEGEGQDEMWRFYTNELQKAFITEDHIFSHAMQKIPRHILQVKEKTLMVD